MTVIWLASLIALATAGACFGALRKLTRPRVSSADLNAWIDINWQSCRPMERLLDPSEFEFLRHRGLSKQRIQQLRARRRALFRMYLRRLTHEFNSAHDALRRAVVNSSVDRPDLARELCRQRLVFYRELIGVEVRLSLNSMGFYSPPSLELIRSLERLHLDFCRLAPAMALEA